MYIIGFLGPGLIFLIYALLCVWQIDSAYVPLRNQYYLTQEDIDHLNRGILTGPLKREMIAESQPLWRLVPESKPDSVHIELEPVTNDPRCINPLKDIFPTPHAGDQSVESEVNPDPLENTACWLLRAET